MLMNEDRDIVRKAIMLPIMIKAKNDALKRTASAKSPEDYPAVSPNRRDGFPVMSFSSGYKTIECEKDRGVLLRRSFFGVLPLRD